VPYGFDKAKIALDALDSGRPAGRLVLVSAITPTDAGEGKTTTAIGLAQGFARLGHQVCLALREPSLGPTFGQKGGATGGGLARVVPESDINLHFTGDFHAVGAAHNLLAAMLDNHIHHGNALGIDPRRVTWRRVIDMNDRALRHVVIGLGGVLEGVPRETGFDITPASEVMAALCLAEGHDDLRRRLGRIVVALSSERAPVTAADLRAVGAMMALLKDAMLPNLAQTCDGVPALVHGGPFANIAHGCNSVVATRLALARADWVVTCRSAWRRRRSRSPTTRRSWGDRRSSTSRSVTSSSPPGPATSSRCSARSCGCRDCRRRRRPSAWTSWTAPSCTRPPGLHRRRAPRADGSGRGATPCSRRSPASPPRADLV